jgi:hypothetical protein
VTYDLAWGKQADWEELELFFSQLPKMSFDHANPAWRYYAMTEQQKTKAKVTRLGAYVPAPPRDLGAYDEAADVFTFSSKHNDIYPIIGDVVRWSLGLKKRPESVSK